MAKDAYNQFLEDLDQTAVIAESFKMRLRNLMMKAVEDAYNRGITEGKRRARGLTNG